MFLHLLAAAASLIPDPDIQTERERRARVIRRVMFLRGALCDYGDKDLRGVFQSDISSRSSDGICPLYLQGRWDSRSFRDNLRYPWPATFRESGLADLHAWSETVRFGGAILSCGWLPDHAYAQPAEYPPRMRNFNNALMGAWALAGRSGRERMIAIIDCETQAQVRQLTARFGHIYPHHHHLLRPVSPDIAPETQDAAIFNVMV